MTIPIIITLSALVAGCALFLSAIRIADIQVKKEQQIIAELEKELFVDFSTETDPTKRLKMRVDACERALAYMRHLELEGSEKYEIVERILNTYKRSVIFNEIETSKNK